MMSPAVTRTELNNSDDIIREVGVARPPRKLDRPHALGSAIAGCVGKTPFDTRVAAEQAARRGVTVYRCKTCRRWHVGGVDKK